MKKVAVIGKIHEDGRKILKDSNFSIIDIPDFLNNTIDELKFVDAIAVRTANLSKEVLKECKSLKIVARHGVGYDTVDLDYLNRKNIALAITGSANAATVAEHVMSMFLNLCKLSKMSDQVVREGKFSQRELLENRIELYQKKAFILLLIH